MGCSVGTEKDESRLTASINPEILSLNNKTAIKIRRLTDMQQLFEIAPQPPAQIEVGPEHAGQMIGWFDLFNSTPGHRKAVLALARISPDGAEIWPDESTGELHNQGFEHPIVVVATESLGWSSELQTCRPRPYFSGRKVTTPEVAQAGAFGLDKLQPSASYSLRTIKPFVGQWAVGNEGIIAGCKEQWGVTDNDDSLWRAAYYGAAYHAHSEAMLVDPDMAPRTSYEITAAYLMGKLAGQMCEIDGGLLETLQTYTCGPEAADDFIMSFTDSRDTMRGLYYHLENMRIASSLCGPYSVASVHLANVYASLDRSYLRLHDRARLAEQRVINAIREGEKHTVAMNILPEIAALKYEGRNYGWTASRLAHLLRLEERQLRQRAHAESRRSVPPQPHLVEGLALVSDNVDA